jgi:ABC-type antimicrobial peptide transport system permease subunit
MAPFIKDKYPEIERATRYTWDVTNLFQYETVSFYEMGKYVDPDFLLMFSFPFVTGSPETALRDKNTMVITEKMAIKYFGDATQAIGKVFLLNTENSFTVTAVVKDVPKNSSIQFDYLLPFAFFWDENVNWLGEWDNNNIRTFLLLKEGADPAAFSEKLRHEIKEHVAETNVVLHTQPFGASYLYGNFENGVMAGGRIEYVRIFFIVAVFVLSIACINFMNLSTAQATKRAKEVGLRKVIGAVPAQVFRQFMGESFLTVCLGAALAVVIVMFVLPLFNDLTGKAMTLDLLDGRILLIFIGIIVFTAFAAGAYPSLFMADFKPVQVLKGQLKSGRRAAAFRRGLVVVQFTLSIVLIISTVVVFRQMDFMQKRDIGFDRSNVFYVWMAGDVKAKYETFRTRLLAMPGIERVTASSQAPLGIGNSTYGVDWEGKDPTERILFTNLNIDYEFIDAMKMQMVEGRPFDRSRLSDTSNYIVNEKAAAKFGFKDGTADQDLTMWEIPGKIVGVVKDFNFGSLHSDVEPLILRMQESGLNCILVRGRANETESALRSAETLWKEYAPNYPFRYDFLSQDWDNFYKAEAQRGRVFNTMAILSIFISCLGLFGLSAFSAERRTKELGIRKALGATMPGLVGLMGMEFTKLVLLAAGIGCPLGWYVMNQWLSGYAYHINVGYITLILAAIVCLAISLLTISYHAFRVAASDPAKSLRYE